MYCCNASTRSNKVVPVLLSVFSFLRWRRAATRGFLPRWGPPEPAGDRLHSALPTAVQPELPCRRLSLSVPVEGRGVANGKRTSTPTWANYSTGAAHRSSSLRSCGWIRESGAPMFFLFLILLFKKRKKKKRKLDIHLFPRWRVRCRNI